jgi:hypothetical protein
MVRSGRGKVQKMSLECMGTLIPGNDRRSEGIQIDACKEKNDDEERYVLADRSG